MAYEFPRARDGSAAGIRQESRAQEAIGGILELARNGHVVENIEIAAAQTLQIAHRLRRVPRGWLILSPRGTPFVLPVMVAKDETFIHLLADDDSEFDLLVW